MKKDDVKRVVSERMLSVESTGRGCIRGRDGVWVEERWASGNVGRISKTQTPGRRVSGRKKTPVTVQPVEIRNVKESSAFVPFVMSGWRVRLAAGVWKRVGENQKKERGIRCQSRKGGCYSEQSADTGFFVGIYRCMVAKNCD
jgi:hypothetical protein